MGRRRQRKRERQLERRLRREGRERRSFGDLEPTPEELELIALEQEGRWLTSLRAPSPVCANCAEFVEDDLSMRGSCLHPGSGVAFPWLDSAACQFFRPSRRPVASR